tara:strand:+ start:1173 stop:2093 length:921 start_codon:yes stop_codon:yes gene_type:complete
MADTLKLRRGNTSACNSFTGVEGEIVIDTTKKTVVVQDGTAGGEALMKESGGVDASTVTIGTGGTTALTIDGSQNFNVYKTLKIRDINGADDIVHISTADDILTIGAFGTDGALQVKTGSGNTLAVTIDKHQNAQFEGDIKVADDKGIDFSAYDGNDTSGTATGNILKDYEEGTFNPTLSAGGDNGSGGAVPYGSRSGHYVKIGRKVHVDFFIEIDTSAQTTGVGYKVGGLPFTTSSANYVRGGGCITYHTLPIGTSGGTANAVIALYGSQGSTETQLYQANTPVKGDDNTTLSGKYLIGFYEYIT